MNTKFLRTANFHSRFKPLLDRFWALLEKYDHEIFLVIGLILAAWVRIELVEYVSGDANILIPWYQYIRNNGGILALKDAFSNYPPLYLYMLTASYYLNDFVLKMSELAAVKLVAIPFDFFAAFWVAKIVNLKYPSKTPAYSAALLYLFAPTLLINAAMWGQIDGIFTSFMLASLYYLLRKQDALAMLAFGFGFSIKFQIIFFAPVLLLMWMLRSIRLRTFLIPLAIYFATLIPAWILGRPLGDMLSLYIGQMGAFDALTLNAPTLYALIDNSVNYLFNRVGVLSALVFTLVAVFGIYRLRPRLTPEVIMSLAAVCVLLVPYILPKMHERYFYPAEVFAILFAFYKPRMAFLPIGLQIVSLSTFSTYLFGTTYLSLTNASLLMLVLLVAACYALGLLIMANRQSEGE